MRLRFFFVMPFSAANFSHVVGSAFWGGGSWRGKRVVRAGSTTWRMGRQGEEGGVSVRVQLDKEGRDEGAAADEKWISPAACLHVKRRRREKDHPGGGTDSRRRHKTHHRPHVRRSLRRQLKDVLQQKLHVLRRGAQQRALAVSRQRCGVQRVHVAGGKQPQVVNEVVVLCRCRHGGSNSSISHSGPGSLKPCSTRKLFDPQEKRQYVRGEEKTPTRVGPKIQCPNLVVLTDGLL